MSKPWRPEGKIVPIRPAVRRGTWTRPESYAGRGAGGSARRILLVLAGAALIGLGAGAMLNLAEPPKSFPTAEEIAREAQPRVETIVPDVEGDPADAEWQGRANSSSVVATPDSSPGEAIQPGLPRASRARNDVAGQSIYVIDGDTFVLGRQKVRIANIDAPEMHPPRCAEEARLGLAAAEKLRALLSSGTVTLSSSGSNHDEHGRLLRTVAVNGQDVGEALIAAGLAREYGSGRRGWC